MPRKTDSNNPADWLLIVESDLELLRQGIAHEWSFPMCRGKLAEVVEKLVKAELIRTGWELEKTHDLERLRLELEERKSDLEPQFAPLCAELAEAYFTDRYPGFDLDDPTGRSCADSLRWWRCCWPPCRPGCSGIHCGSQ